MLKRSMAQSRSKKRTKKRETTETSKLLTDSCKIGMIFLSLCLSGILTVLLVNRLFTEEQKKAASSIDFNSTNGKLKVESSRGFVLEGNLGINLMELIEYSPIYSLDQSVQPESVFSFWHGIAHLEITHIETEEPSINCNSVRWTIPSGSHLRHHLDCFQLGTAHWYGGAEVYYQHWPLEKADHPMTKYISDDMIANPDNYGSLLERYWVSSNGVTIYVEPDIPLHVSLNASGDQQICFKSTYEGNAYPHEENQLPELAYTICTAEDLKSAHLHSIRSYFDKPSGIPDEKMFRYPIWSTWAQFKVFINESVVLRYAQDIVDNGFPHAQLEIDDGWTFNYGDLEFKKDKFPDARAMCDQLHSMGYQLTIWTHPFANLNTKTFREGKTAGYWVMGPQGTASPVIWWNGFAGILDVTNQQAVEWFVDRLQSFRTKYNIDSFKFDAGEAKYLPKNFTTYQRITNPCQYTTNWIEAASRFGAKIEVRVGFRSQKNPVFVRMMDKHSDWTIGNGLKTLIPTALTFGILGYPFVLPDMIGGNAYEECFRCLTLPERELYIRWLQINAFLPSMQFSIPPWRYDEEVVKISRYWVDFHNKTVAPLLLSLAEEAVKTGHPIIRPIWWIAPEDKQAQVIDTEFLVGDKLLVAPILEKGVTSREVYLPSNGEPGELAYSWKNAHTGEYVKSGKWVTIPCPLNETLYFTRLDNLTKISTT